MPLLLGLTQSYHKDKKTIEFFSVKLSASRHRWSIYEQEFYVVT